jgi:AraC family transcriptional regulator, arabinose operon regulatory protein
VKPIYDPAHDPANDPLISILAGYSLQGSGYRIQRKYGTPNWLFVYTLSGEGKVIHSGGRALCKPGSVAIWSPNSNHDYGLSAHGKVWEQLWAHWVPSPAYQQVLARLTGNMPFFILEREEMHDPQAGFRELTSQPKSALGQLRAVNHLESFVLDISERIADSVQFDPVTQAMQYISAHLSSEICIDDIAHAAGLSPSRLSTVFREKLGISPRDYLERERMTYAKQLLRNTTQSIQSISMEVGFSSPFYFTLRFKKDTGLSPTEYRKTA